MIKGTFTRRALLGATAAAATIAFGAGAYSASSSPAPAKVEQTSVQAAYTRKDAFRASTDHIVLHYGADLKGVDQIAEILKEDGFPTLAYRGGKPGQVEMFVAKGKFGPYDQDDVDNGTLAASAIGYYRTRIQKASTLAANAPAND